KILREALGNIDSRPRATAQYRFKNPFVGIRSFQILIHSFILETFSTLSVKAGKPHCEHIESALPPLATGLRTFRNGTLVHEQAIRPWSRRHDSSLHGLWRVC